MLNVHYWGINLQEGGWWWFNYCVKAFGQLPYRAPRKVNYKWQMELQLGQVFRIKRHLFSKTGNQMQTHWNHQIGILGNIPKSPNHLNICTRHFSFCSPVFQKLNNFYRCLRQQIIGQARSQRCWRDMKSISKSTASTNASNIYPRTQTKYFPIPFFS